MTLIVTTISALGILQASDSNLTGVRGLAGEGQKVFPLGFAPGALALAGSYQVAGESMKTWMPRLIGEYGRSDTPTLEGFAQRLKERLDRDADSTTGLLVHIAGYTSGSDVHPEMWFVRNFSTINEMDGSYEDRTEEFMISEDFWRRDYPGALARGYQPGNRSGWKYFNGLPDGRISYNLLRQMLEQFFAHVWSHPGWSFRPPKTIDEAGELMRLELSVVGTLFELSDYPAPYVGGTPQVAAIPPPLGAVAL